MGTPTGIDELQVLRIVLSNLLSLALVLLAARRRRAVSSPPKSKAFYIS